MNRTIDLYICDEQKIPTSLSDFSLSERFSRLSSFVAMACSKWMTVEIDMLRFAKSLERLDRKIDGSGILPVLSINNSPQNLLGNNSYLPPFGYFSPSQVQDIAKCLLLLSDKQISAEFIDDELTDYILFAYNSTFNEAAKRNHAICVIHS